MSFLNLDLYLMFAVPWCKGTKNISSCILAHLASVQLVESTLKTVLNQFLLSIRIAIQFDLFIDVNKMVGNRITQTRKFCLRPIRWC